MRAKRVVPLAVGLAFVVLSTGVASAEVIIINAIQQDLRIQLGHADQNGNVAWSPYTIPACQAMTLQEDPALRTLYPKYIDERKNHDTGQIDYEFVMVTQPAQWALGLYGDKLVLDVFGTGRCP